MARQIVEHYIPFFGRDFLTATTGWTAEERGHYVTLLIVQWEQGSVPSAPERLEIISPGLSRCWAILEPKFPVGHDGRRRNARLEEHRSRAESIKEARSEAGRHGNVKRWGDGSQTDRKPIANAIANRSGCGSQTATVRHEDDDQAQSVGTPNPQFCESRQDGSQNDRKTIANGIAKRSHPSPSPSPREKDRTHTRAAVAVSDKPERQEAGAGQEWERFVSAWNRTDRAVPWTLTLPPSGWEDLAGNPGWLSRAAEAMGRLPACEYFDRPLALTRFFEFVDRILAGEFREAKAEPGHRRKRQPTGGNL